MKYLIITSFFPDDKSFRGPFVYDQVKALEEMGDNEIIVFKPYSFFSKPQKDYIYNGVKVYRFPHIRLPFMLFPGLFDKLTQWLFIRKIKSLSIKINDIAYCHSHAMLFGNIANLLKKKSPKIKTIIQYHHFDLLALRGYFSIKYKWHLDYATHYATEICNKTDLHIGVSNKVLDGFLNYPKIKLKNTYVLYNGVNTSIFHPILNKTRNEYFHIGCIANFKIFKGHITLIKAIEELAKKRNIKIKATLIGTGETRSECERYCIENELDDIIAFKNEMQHHFLPKFYYTLDLYVMPSYWETFGCVYTESYSCGVPFIACENQGIGELINKEDHAKWLVKPHDHIELANKIEYYIYNRAEQRLNNTIEINNLIASYLIFLRNLSKVS